VGKITVQEQQLTVKHRKELTELIMKANFQRHIVLSKSTTHSNNFVILNKVTISMKFFY
jgi:hypothetical protein